MTNQVKPPYSVPRITFQRSHQHLDCRFAPETIARSYGLLLLPLPTFYRADENKLSNCPLVQGQRDPQDPLADPPLSVLLSHFCVYSYAQNHKCWSLLAEHLLSSTEVISRRALSPSAPFRDYNSDLDLHAFLCER